MFDESTCNIISAVLADMNEKKHHLVKVRYMKIFKLFVYAFGLVFVLCVMMNCYSTLIEYFNSEYFSDIFKYSFLFGFAMFYFINVLLDLLDIVLLKICYRRKYNDFKEIK